MYNERVREGACNTRPDPDFRPAFTGAKAMPYYRPIPKLTPAQNEMFWNRVEVHHPAGCWEWSWSKNQLGYGVVWFDQIRFLAHRVAYSLLIGPIEHGLVLDHLCQNKSCVNPDHIRVTTHRINVLRNHGASATHFRLRLSGVCPNGHPVTPENTLPENKSGHRCRQCRIERRRRYRATLAQGARS